MIEKLLKTGCEYALAAGLLIGCAGHQVDHNKVYLLNPGRGEMTAEHKTIQQPQKPKRDFIPLGKAEDLEAFVKKHGWDHVKYLEQIVCLTDSINENPKNIEAYFARGLSYQMIDQYEEAIRDYDEVLSLDKSLTNVYFNRGLAKKALGRYVEAISDFKKCSLIRKDDAAESQIKLCGELESKGIRPTEKDSPRLKMKSGCYITTACVKAASLPDDCFELQTLRNFRDNFMSKIPCGNILIDAYYRTAPGIVQRINAQKNSREIFCRLFEKDILTAVKLVQKGDYDQALGHYMSMTLRLNIEF